MADPFFTTALYRAILEGQGAVLGFVLAFAAAIAIVAAGARKLGIRAQTATN